MKGSRPEKYPRLRIISSSGAPLHATLKLEIETLFGLVLHNGYGVTECSPNIAQARIEGPGQRVEAHGQYVTVGHVFPGEEVRLARTPRQPAPKAQILA